MSEFDKMRFYVFVARDDAEYERYHDSAFKKINGLRYPGKCFFRGDEFGVLVLVSGVKHDGETGKNLNGKVQMMCEDVVAAIMTACNRQADDVEKTLEDLNKDGCVNLFVHWGGDGWEDKESRARGLLKKNSYFGKWSIFALSSQRPELWNVKGKSIRLPKHRQDFRRLDERVCFEIILKHDLIAIALNGFNNENKEDQAKLARIKEALNRYKYDDFRLWSEKNDKIQTLCVKFLREETGFND